MAAALRKESGVDVEVTDGGKGEFTVLVDGREVIRKGESLPAAAAVQEAMMVGPAAMADDGN